MSRNGSGVYTLPTGNPVVPSTTITTTWANSTLSDIASALTQSVASDGQTPMTGDLNMNGHSIQNLVNFTYSGLITGGDIDVYNSTVNGVSNFNSYGKIKALLEKATITASYPASTANFDALTQVVQYYTTNAVNNWVINLRGNSTTSLDSIMSVGDSLSFTMLVTNGATPYYATGMKIDGSAVTPKWINGVFPTAGNASSIDVYTFVVIKTLSATFQVLASQTKFAQDIKCHVYQ